MSIHSHHTNYRANKKELHSVVAPSPEVLLSHKGHLQLDFRHNHPLTSAHVLSFRPISEETKGKYHKLFRSGHSAASAHHYYDSTLMDECTEDTIQSKIADRAQYKMLADSTNNGEL